jgi:HK97 gp10 family phage protein
MAEIKGLGKLQTKLEQIAKVDITNGALKAGFRVERDAKLMVPVDTGLLRGSITTAVVEKNKVVVGTSVEYAPNVEFGIGQRAQPYLTPAFQMNRENIIADIKEETKKQIEGTAK